MAKRERDNGWERFRVIEELGAGAFGRTLLVSDTKSNEQVVIKVPHDKRTEEALINELMNATALSANLIGIVHPNIVKCLGFSRYEDFYVMMLEYIPGKDLRKIIGPMQITRQPNLLPKRAIEIATNVCAGLVVAHRINLLHRDIKPDNIRIHQDDGVPKILDFGISKIMQSSGVGSGTVVGTFPYMAPEALTGHACMASDTWSLCVTLYEMVTGRLPFWDENLFSLKKKIDMENPIPPHDLNPSVDEWLSTLIMQGLDKNPKKRFETAQSMLDALTRQCIDHEISELRRIFQEGKEDEAERKAIKLLEHMEREPRLYMLVGEFFNRRQHFLQAENIIRQGIKACPDHAELYFYLGPALWNQGGKKQQQALIVLERALKLGLSSAQGKQARNLLRSWKSREGR